MALNLSIDDHIYDNGVEDYLHYMEQHGSLDCYILFHDANFNVFIDEDYEVVNIYDYLTPNDVAVYRADRNSGHLFVKHDDPLTMVELYPLGDSTRNYY